MHYFSRFMNTLPVELRKWVGDDLVSEQQARAICGRYNLDYDSGARLRDRAPRVLMVLASLLMGAGLLVLIQHNWHELPRALRMSGMLLLTLGLNAQAIRLVMAAGKLTGAAEALLFAGTVSYGASIMLIAQIYNVGEHYPDGILYWALGGMAVAVVANSKAVAIFAAILSIVWLYTEDYNAALSITMFPVFLLAIALMLRQRSSKLMMFLLLFGGVNWWLSSVGWIGGDFYWRDGSFLSWGLVLVSISLLLYASRNICSHRHAGNLAEYQGMLGKLLSLSMMFSFLCAMIVLDLYVTPHYEHEDWNALGAGSSYASIVLLVIFSLFTIPKDDSGRRPVLPVVAISLHAVAVTVLVSVAFNWFKVPANGLPFLLTSTGVICKLIAIFGFVLYAVASIRAGEALGSAFQFYAGSVSIIIVVGYIYFELVGGSYVITAAFLMGCAAFIYVMARRWHKLSPKEASP